MDACHLLLYLLITRGCRRNGQKMTMGHFIVNCQSRVGVFYTAHNTFICYDYDGLIITYNFVRDSRYRREKNVYLIQTAQGENGLMP